MPRGTLLPSGGGGTILPPDLKWISDQISPEDIDWVIYGTGDEEQEISPSEKKVKGFVLFCEDFEFEGRKFVKNEPLKFKVNESDLTGITTGVCDESGVTEINFTLKKPVIGGIYADKIEKI